ncbi:MAG: acetylglutamate kinase [Paludibacteraceae bacterium]|nr:acetylglutamate kinase [Paludibacteraceae bacterium]
MIQVIKIGGGILENEASREMFLRQFAAVEGPKVLVHGGGRLATTMAERLGVKTQMIDGRRVTDKETLDIVTMVYGGLVNKQVVTLLHTMGVNAIGLTGADGGWMKSVKRPIKNGIDYGYVGDVIEVNGAHLHRLLDNGLTPVIAPITYSAEGLLLNTNADTVASQTAIAMAEAMRREGDEARGNVQLTFCFEKAGVLSNPDDESSLIARITPDSYTQLKADGIISGGMIPKIDNAFAALQEGVQTVRITHASNILGGTIIELI